MLKMLKLLLLCYSL